jgi:hypothetical protein
LEFYKYQRRQLQQTFALRKDHHLYKMLAGNAIKWVSVRTMRFCVNAM